MGYGDSWAEKICHPERSEAESRDLRSYGKQADNWFLCRKKHVISSERSELRDPRTYRL